MVPPASRPDPMQAALKHLERRARTTFEVRAHLKGRGFDGGEIAEVITRLSSMGYLDDRRYAERYAAWSAEERPMGRRRLSLELSRRGLKRDTIESALDEAFGPELEAMALERAMRKAVRTAALPCGRPAEKERRRVAAFLLRRGFRPGQVLAAVETWVRSAGPEHEQEQGE